MDELIKKYGSLSEEMMKLFKLVSLLSTVFGAFLALMYCLKIRYFPVGLTVGDSLFFIWLAVVFGFLYLSLLVLIAYSLVLPYRVKTLIKRDKKKQNNKVKVNWVDEIFYNGMSLAIGLILLYVSFLMESLGAMIQTIIVIGVLYAVYRKEDTSEVRNVFVKPLILLLIVFSPALFAGISGGLLDKTMLKIGIKINSATISIDKDTSDSLVKELLRKKLAYKVGKKCKKQCVFYDVDVAFTGVGVNTVLSFSDKENTYNFPIKNMALSLMYKQ